MISRAKWLLQSRGAVPADFEQAIGKLDGMFVAVHHASGEY